MNNQFSDQILTTTESFLVVLDSRNSTTFNNGDWISDVTFDLQDSIRQNIDTLSISVVISSFTCPVSFYQINVTNNLLTIRLNTTKTNFYIPLGNYNSTTFITYLLTVLPSDFTITINPINNIITMKSITTTFLIYGTSTIYNIMGFKLNTSISSSTISGGGYQIVMPYTCNFAGLNSFNISIDNIRTLNINSLTLSTCNIIASVPINASQNGVLYYEKRNEYELTVKEDSLDYFDITIKDDLGNLINFNNQSWNLVLQFNVTSNKKRFNTSFHEELTNSHYNKSY